MMSFKQAGCSVMGRNGDKVHRKILPVEIDTKSLEL